MTERYPHVFRYGKPDSRNRQRWAFRFAIVDPHQAHVRGRPAALVNAFGAAIGKGDNEQCFYTPHRAAVECDTWKFYLGRYYGVPNLTWSFGSYDQFSLAYGSTHKGASPEDYTASKELSDFIAANAEVWERITSSEPGGWNADLELHSAQRNLDKVRNSSEYTDDEKRRYYTMLDWAKRFKNHMTLVREVEEYGATKLEAEATMNVDLLEKARRYALHWSRPAQPHFHLRGMLEQLAADREKIEELLVRLRTTQLSVRAFVAKLPLDTEVLKEERIKL